MPHYLTKPGLKKLQSELELLKTSARREVIDRIAAAKELGDLKENAEYAEAKDDQAMLESKIAEMEATLKDAVLIEEERSEGSTVVQVGSRVHVECNGNRCMYTIVGTEESDPSALRISNESPLGRAFLNKSRGDKVVVRVPKGEFEYIVVEIE
ncbi:transcription elongation factor GreA [Candidatus Uhrbacteria bacterium]|nr:transcription elongation factor GreA [Candidatus Uhrbacteria bacterium]